MAIPRAPVSMLYWTCILLVTSTLALAAEQPAPAIMADAAAAAAAPNNQLHMERLSTQYLEVQKAAIEVVEEDSSRGRTLVKVQLREEDVAPTLPTVTADLTKGLCTNIASAWKVLKGYALMHAKASDFNKQAAAASGAPPLFPRPSVAHRAASHLPSVSFDLADYLARAEAAGHQRDWLHSAPPNAALMPHGADYGAIADILSVDVGPASDDPTKSVATLGLELVHSPKVVSELQPHPPQTQDEAAHFHLALPTGIQHDAGQLLSLAAQGSGALVHGLSLFMKGGNHNPCNNLTEGALCTPQQADPTLSGPCAPYTCVKENTELHCRIKLSMAGTVCSAAKSACQPARVCTGDSPTCPNTVAPNGIKCPYTDEDHNPLFMPLADKAKPADVSTDASGTPNPAASTSGYYREPPYGGWPDCWGRCSAGVCALDETKPGCCYLNTWRHGSSYDAYGPYGSSEYGYPGAEAEGYEGRRHNKGYEQHEGYSGEGDEHRRSGLVCWGNGQA